MLCWEMPHVICIIVSALQGWIRRTPCPMETQDCICHLLRRACQTSPLQRYIFHTLCFSVPQPGALNPWRLHFCHVLCSRAGHGSEAKSPGEIYFKNYTKTLNWVFPAVCFTFTETVGQRVVGAAGWWPGVAGHPGAPVVPRAVRALPECENWAVLPARETKPTAWHSRLEEGEVRFSKKQRW